MTTNHLGLLSTLMVLVGLGIPVMAALNSGLALRLGSPVLASIVLFSLALVATLTVLMLQPKALPAPVEGISWYLWTGGLVVAAYVISITAVAPRIGVGNAIFLVLLGQLIASAAIDHFAFLGAPHVALSPRRAAGIVLMLIGVSLARRPPDIS